MRVSGVRSPEGPLFRPTTRHPSTIPLEPAPPSTGPLSRGLPIQRVLASLEPNGYAYVTNNYLPNMLDRRLSFRKIGLFAGKIDLATINEDELWTLTFRYDGSKTPEMMTGDYRDWKLIRAWAEQVAVDLEATISRR